MNKNFYALRYEQVETDGHDKPLAIRHASRERCSKRYTQERARTLTTGAFLRGHYRTQAEAFPRIWLSNVCTGQCPAEWARSAQEEGASKTRSVSWPVTQPCSIRGTGPEPEDRPCFPTIPCQI